MSEHGGQRALVLELGDQRWSLQGGWRDGDMLGLRLAVVSGEDVLRYSIRLPLDTDGETLAVGPVTVEEGWPA